MPLTWFFALFRNRPLPGGVSGFVSGASARRPARKPVPGEVATFGLSLQGGIVLQWPFLMLRRPPETVYPGVCQFLRVSGTNRFWGNLGRFWRYWRNKSWRRRTRKKERPPISRRALVAEDAAGTGQGAGLHAWRYRERSRFLKLPAAGGTPRFLAYSRQITRRTSTAPGYTTR